MARDRLAALRVRTETRGSPEPTNATGEYEMAGLQTQDHITNGNGTSSADGMTRFYSQISNIQDELRRFDANVSRISDLHSRSLNNTDEALSQQNAAALDDLVAETRSLSNQIKNEIQELEKEPVPPGQDARIRRNQTSLVRSKFIEALQNYQQVEQQYRTRYRQRVERQFKIVKPDATPDEITAVVRSDQGAGGQIFAQALTSSTRYGESRAAYREVQERHEDIRKIERTLAELAQMFIDMDVLVAQQDDTINAIETSAAQVEGDTEAGLVQTEKAVKHARSARRKRWICFFIFLIILAIVGVAVGVTVGKH
ncbi:t-SNARE [Multifurca ochricompacta]|uniref:t-SNARE n=1 Tax=Multifurca ochricompacta TaxID=376703 RepID=A0AAD4QS27_9AGAM|nr:t-SNARE [Multifurca ochricompacta]